MQIPRSLNARERGEYLRGLLLIMAADGIKDDREVKDIRNIGNQLDFEAQFIEESMQKILTNTYVSKAPPVFDKPEHAQLFVNSAIAVASSDGDIADAEYDYILRAGKANGMALPELENQLQDARSRLQDVTSPNRACAADSDADSAQTGMLSQ
jgi:hypothetical protein